MIEVVERNCFVFSYPGFAFGACVRWACRRCYCLCHCRQTHSFVYSSGWMVLEVKLKLVLVAAAAVDAAVNLVCGSYAALV